VRLDLTKHNRNTKAAKERKRKLKASQARIQAGQEKNQKLRAALDRMGQLWKEEEILGKKDEVERRI
jgi:hypothetical protein